MRERPFHEQPSGSDPEASGNLAAGNDETTDSVEHFVAVVNLADISDPWCKKSAAVVAKGGLAIDHAGWVFVTLDDSQIICLGAARS